MQLKTHRNIIVTWLTDILPPFAPFRIKLKEAKNDYSVDKKNSGPEEGLRRSGTTGEPGVARREGLEGKGRKHMQHMQDRSIFCRYSEEEGFSLLELVVVVIILGIFLLVATVNYADSRKGITLRSGVEEVEKAITRCRNIALQEGVDVYLEFWDPTGEHPNQYAIYRAYPNGVNEYVERTPTENPTSASSYTTDGEGHYWFNIAEGAVEVQSAAVFLFQRRGTAVVVTVVEPVGGEFRVTLRKADLTGTITFNDLGEII